MHAQAELLSPCTPMPDQYLPAPDALQVEVPICAEAALAAEALEGLPEPLTACTAEERGYKPRPKKGRPIDKGPVLR